jgi:hypothetical protein
LVGASLITVAPVAPPPLYAQARAVQLTNVDAATAADPEYVAYYNGGSNDPIPSPDQLANVLAVYLQPHYPELTSLRPLGQPAQLYPLAGPHAGFLDDSEKAAQKIEDAILRTQLGLGHHLLLAGESGGATENTMEMRYLASLPPDEQPSPDQLSFFLLGDPNNDNGGMLDRFDIPGIQTQTFPDLGSGTLGGLNAFTGPIGVVSLPTIGVTFNGPTPADTPYPTISYTGEYDGFSDFPKYPLDLLADLNALLGIEFVHNPEPENPASLIDQAFEWQPSPGYDGNTTWYIFPTENLPLLDPIRGNPMGDAIADLLQPDLKVLVNLGYGPDNVGYSQYPDVFTPIQPGLPHVPLDTLLNELVDGAEKGMHDFMSDLNGITPSSMFASLENSVASALPAVTPMDLDPGDLGAELQTLLTDNSNALAIVVATPFDALMQIADTTAALGITLPTYDLNLGFLGFEQLADGNLNSALTYFGDIPAATAGLFSIAGVAVFLEGIFETNADTITNAIQAAVTEDMDFLAGLPALLP